MDIVKNLNYLTIIQDILDEYQIIYNEISFYRYFTGILKLLYQKLTNQNIIFYLFYVIFPI